MTVLMKMAAFKCVTLHNSISEGLGSKKKKGFKLTEKEIHEYHEWMVFFSQHELL